MIHLVLVTCLLVVAASERNQQYDKLPVSVLQAEDLAYDVCDAMFQIPEEIISCQLKFTGLAASRLPPGPDVTVTSHRKTQIQIEVPPSEYHQLIVLIPINDTSSTIQSQIIDPAESKSEYELDLTNTENLQIWSATLDSQGQRGTWTAGLKLPNIEDEKHIVKLANFTIDDEDTDHPTVSATFSWNSSYDADKFVPINICRNSNANCVMQPIVQDNDLLSITIRKLDLDDDCNITVYRDDAKSQLNYHTPSTTAKDFVPEIPKDIDIVPIPSEGAGEEPTWDVQISWAPPERAPKEYQVTLVANSTHNLHISGTETSVVIPNVTGERLFYVTIEASTSLDTAVAHRKAYFPFYRNNHTSAGADTDAGAGASAAGGAVWRALGAGGGALLVCAALASLLWLGRRRADEPEPDKDFGSEQEALVEDSWELAPERLLLQEVVGEGAFGLVRKGTLAPSGKEVAVKMLKDCPSVEEIRSFRAEMELMKSVGAHPHVVSLVGCCSRRRPLIVAEYCPRGDLLNYLRCAMNIMLSKRNATYYNNNIESDYRNDLFKNVPQKEYSKFVVNKLYDLHGVCDAELTLVDLISFCRQIAMGMEFLASNRVVHRDLAARNVLVTNDRTLKIADFGLSRDVYQENQYKQQGSGKLPIKWMALESLTDKIYTSQSDVWSFGVVMWEVLTVGATPYPSVAPRRLPRLLRDGLRLPRPPACSKQLYEVMWSCWLPRARDRPTFAALHRRLDTLLQASCALDYLTLELETDEPEPLPPVPKYLGLIPRSKKYWSSKRETYEKPMKTSQSNHYTIPPDSLSKIQVV